MTKRTRENAVYITQLPQDINEEKLSELFGSIGVIKVGTEKTFQSSDSFKVYPAVFFLHIFRFTPAVFFFAMSFLLTKI